MLLYKCSVASQKLTEGTNGLIGSAAIHSLLLLFAFDSFVGCGTPETAPGSSGATDLAGRMNPYTGGFFPQAVTLPTTPPHQNHQLFPAPTLCGGLASSPSS